MISRSHLERARLFSHYLFSRTYRFHNEKAPLPEDILQDALEKLFADVRYHFPDIPDEKILSSIESNSSELAVFLYRLGNALHAGAADASLLDAVHWLMRDLCACEIYYGNHIETGFYVVHGVGTVIGSRNSIGKGFVIYQNCTIGKTEKGQPGCRIGSDVRMYANSHIIGNIEIGDNVVISSYSLVDRNVPPDSVCKGIPAKIVSKL